MQKKERMKMINDVFAPKSGEKVLIFYDTPHDNIKDNDKWKESRQMAKRWYETFKEMGDSQGFIVDISKYNSPGLHNTQLPNSIIDKIKKYNLVIVFMEYSISSTLIEICHADNSITRGAGLHPEKRMEEGVFKANYPEVKKYAISIKNKLTNAIGAEIVFSTDDYLFIDLRNRNGYSDEGDCTKTGQYINFPSGEGFIAPYEASTDENKEFGKSKTEGIWPVSYYGELLKYRVKNNRIDSIIGKGPMADEARKFYAENISRRNIAELGIGCNPKAIVTGNVLEDEKVGLHIAYGTSTHFGGKVQSDTHFDIVYAKGCPVEGKSLKLVYEDGSKIEIVKDGMVKYNLLK
jgi:leucyl aminopeptidase (aminopeptidase T)